MNLYCVTQINIYAHYKWWSNDSFFHCSSDTRLSSKVRETLQLNDDVYDAQMILKETVHTEISIMSVQTCTTFFRLWNTKADL